MNTEASQRKYELYDAKELEQSKYSDQYEKYRLKNHAHHYKKDFFYNLLRGLTPEQLGDTA